MSEQWQVDLSESARRFSNIVYPKIKEKWFGGAELAPVEVVSQEDFADKLDELAGIDYWVIDTDNGMRGIASRVQNQSDWSTFTVRHERPSGVDTELQKRKKAIDEGYLYPYWTIQAYTPRDRFENVARCQTQALIDYIRLGTKGKHYKEKETKTGEKFYTVHWEDLERKYEVRYYNQPNQSAKLGNPKSQKSITEF